jgi:hypothetical protein
MADGRGKTATKRPDPPQTDFFLIKQRRSLLLASARKLCDGFPSGLCRAANCERVSQRGAGPANVQSAGPMRWRHHARATPISESLSWRELGTAGEELGQKISRETRCPV